MQNQCDFDQLIIAFLNKAGKENSDKSSTVEKLSKLNSKY